MRQGLGNLRISYLGGGYDYPVFFQEKPVVILSEALRLPVSYSESEIGLGSWTSPVGQFSGLGSSAARYLSFLRYHFPGADFRSLVDIGIRMDGLQGAGWQDAIAAAHSGFLKITLYKRNWWVESIESGLGKYRKLYKIPVCREQKEILSEMVCRWPSFLTMQGLVREGEVALGESDFQTFGGTVTAAWNLKKRWHPQISNSVIEQMEKDAVDIGAWGWKVCGAGGQGYFLVIGSRECHSRMSEKYECFGVGYE